MPRRVAVGIRRHGSGYEAYVRVRGDLLTRTFPADARIEDMQLWRATVRAARRPTPEPSAAGTLGADVTRYLKLVVAMPSIATRRRHLALWVMEFGADRARAGITRDDVRTGLQAFIARGYSPQYVRHLRNALGRLWRVLDGPDARPPTIGVETPPIPPPAPRAIPVDILRRILRALPATKTGARYRLLAVLGITPAEQKRLTADDVRRAFEVGVLRVPARRKGQGAAARLVPLSRDGRRALKAWHRLGCYGPWSTSGARKRWLEVCAALGVTGYRPYDARHTLGAALYAKTGDLATVARILGHADLSTTRRYAAGANAAVDARAMSGLPSLLRAPRKQARKQAKVSGQLAAGVGNGRERADTVDRASAF